MIYQNIDLSQYSTFKIGGEADYFTEVKTKNGLKKAFKFAEKNKIPYLILGGGSNIVFDDEGFRGIVIKMENKDLIFKKDHIEAESGVLMGFLVLEAAKREIDYSKWAGIPGTLGGATAGNAGAHGFEMKDAVIKAELFDFQKQDFITVDKNWFDFKYRKSRILKSKNYIIWKIFLDIKEKKDTVKIKDQIIAYKNKRNQKHPLDPSCGSFFKNPIIDRDLFEKIQKKHPDIKHFVLEDKKIKLVSAWLIDYLNLKGMHVNSAAISQKHANFLVNLKNAQQKDVIALVKKVIAKVYDEFGFKLYPEVKILDQFGNITQF